MYIPAQFAADPADLAAFLRRYSFATLVGVLDGVPYASHVPVLYDADARTLRGHLAHANPHAALFGAPDDMLAIFHGPHAYISPTMYVTTPNVPTWNYQAVHAYGPTRVLTAEELSATIDDTVRFYESGRETPWDGSLPADYRAGLLKGVVGFEMRVTRLEGKFKLGQNRKAEDRESMRAHLVSGDADERAVAAAMTENP